MKAKKHQVLESEIKANAGQLKVLNKIGQQMVAVQKDGHSLLVIVILFQLMATQFLMVSNTRKVFSLPDIWILSLVLSKFEYYILRQ